MRSTPLLERLGLHRRELRAWALYDWANSAFVTTIMAAIFPIYYDQVAAAELTPDVALYRFAMATFVALFFVALLSPLLGALSDLTGRRKALLLGFQCVSVTATALMWFIERGDWLLALGLFVVGNVGVAGAFTFYDALLRHVARVDELDRVSAAGYALGYLGGGLLLAVNMAWIVRPAWFGFPNADVAARASFVSVALWWTVFSIPLYRRVSEPAPLRARREVTGTLIWGAAFGRLGETFHELRRFRAAFVMLLAFFFYNDGINTIIRMASIYGAQVGIAHAHLMGALLMVQFVGIPFAFLFGHLAGKIGVKRAIFLALAVYLAVTVLGYRMTTAVEFYVLALLVATVQGGSQALSRSLFASLVPRQKVAELFGFFAVCEKFAGILGPLVFAQSVQATGSGRTAILAVASFFVVGGVLLSRVDVARGRQVAREAEALAGAE
jgi:UMF1 family MFS transporter